MKILTLHATLATFTLLTLSACGHKPPDCSDPDVVSAATQETTQLMRNSVEKVARDSISQDLGWKLMTTYFIGMALNKNLHADIQPEAFPLHPQYKAISQKAREAAPDAPVRFVVDTSGISATLSSPIQLEKNVETVLSVCEFRQTTSGKLIATLDVKNLFNDLTADSPASSAPDAKSELAKLEGVEAGTAPGALSKEQREVMAREKFEKMFGSSMIHGNWLKVDAKYDAANLAMKRSYDFSHEFNARSPSVKYNVQRNKEGKLTVSYIEPRVDQK